MCEVPCRRRLQRNSTHVYLELLEIVLGLPLEDENGPSRVRAGPHFSKVSRPGPTQGRPATSYFKDFRSTLVRLNFAADSDLQGIEEKNYIHPNFEKSPKICIWKTVPPSGGY